MVTFRPAFILYGHSTDVRGRHVIARHECAHCRLNMLDGLRRHRLTSEIGCGRLVTDRNIILVLFGRRATVDGIGRKHLGEIRGNLKKESSVQKSLLAGCMAAQVAFASVPYSDRHTTSPGPGPAMNRVCLSTSGALDLTTVSAFASSARHRRCSSSSGYALLRGSCHCQPYVCHVCSCCSQVII